MVEYHRISAKDTYRLHQIVPKVLPDIFFGYVLYAGERIWRGDILVADIEELEEMDASELHAKGSILRKLTPMKDDKFIFPVADGAVKICGGDQRLRTFTLIQDRPERGAKQEILRGESGGLSSPTPHQDDSTRDDAEAKSDFWSVTGNFIHRHQLDPESNCTYRKKNHFLFR